MADYADQEKICVICGHLFFWISLNGIAAPFESPVYAGTFSASYHAVASSTAAICFTAN